MYHEDDVAEMTESEIQAVLHTPEYQEFLAGIEPRWDEVSVDEEFLQELVGPVFELTPLLIIQSLQVA
jgi:hypothetical protein